MGRIRSTTEQIIRKLREAEVEISKGSTVALAVRKIGVPSRPTTAEEESAGTSADH